jgi:hypothetical protein
MQAVNDDPAWYSNPQNCQRLPFAFLSKTLPVERFRFYPDDQVPSFTYMGREQFANVWQMVESLTQDVGRTRLSISGTMGYGKSHILAALACLLARHERHVVFLPDVREMLADPFEYLKTALLCSFSSPSSSSSSRHLLRSCQTLDHLETFCSNNAPLYFIVDQINALDEEESHSDIVANEDKRRLHQLLRRFSHKHPYITGASANHRSAQLMKQKQTNDLKIQMMGGMTTVSVSLSLPSNYLHRHHLTPD